MARPPAKNWGRLTSHSIGEEPSILVVGEAPTTFGGNHHDESIALQPGVVGRAEVEDASDACVVLDLVLQPVPNVRPLAVGFSYGLQDHLGTVVGNAGEHVRRCAEA